MENSNSVSRWQPSEYNLKRLQCNVGAWTNVNAQPLDWDRSDYIAAAGGKWSDRPDGKATNQITTNLNHWNFPELDKKGSRPIMLTCFRFMRKIFYAAFVCGCLFSLVACHTVEPSDMRLEMLNVVQLSDMPGLWSWAHQRNDIKQNEILLLKVTFSSELDLVKFAKTNSYHISYNLAACNAKGDLSGGGVFSIPYVRIGGESIGSGIGFERPNLESRRENGRFNYEIFIPLHSDELSRIYGSGLVISGEEMPLYNYSRDRNDLCFELVGAKMWFGSSFSSNVVRIYHGSILKATQHSLPKSS